ncbi:MAG TPA: hypothetical protein VFF73_17145 [Planctomycetota bacterium]|nr:hypothetical protein [Planctomycetota bacterium]
MKEKGLELEREREPRVCRLCGEPVDGVCPRCGVDKKTGDLVQEPEEEKRHERDGRRPLRRQAARLLAAIPEGTRALLWRGMKQSLAGWSGTLLCLFFVAVALSFQRIPWLNFPIPWPGQLCASFVLAFLSIEHARGAREGGEGALDTRGAFDPSVLGTSLLMSFLLLPLYAGPFMSSLPLALGAGIPIAIIFPACMGALITDSIQELSPSHLKEALFQSPFYMRTMLLSMIALVGGLLAVWLPSEESPLWRAPLAVIGVTFASALIGLLRRDAETMIDDDP